MRLSLVERVLRRTPLPYPAASIALILGVIVVGISLSNLADTGNVQGAFYYLGLSWTSQIVFLIGNLVLPVYALLSIRYMKNKVTSKEAGLIDISPEGEKTLDKVFKNVASTLPVILIAALLLIPTIINQDYIKTVVGPITAVAYLISLAVVSLIYACFLWTYISLVRGLYQLGKYPLKLAPFYQDNTL